jgi:O-antigen biosynthesis protein
MALVKRILRALPLLLLSPFLLLIAILALALVDLLHRRTGILACPRAVRPASSSATVVIPNWNGADLLAKYLPSVIEALAANPANEIIVVDNGSTDGSADFLRATFPTVKVLALPENLGFGEGSNAGFREAKNDIVVLLNSDMRVAPDFLAPLLEGFDDPDVFAVSCQIFFSDPNKLRVETGLTQAWWQHGGLRVRHRDDVAIQDLYPCFYGGGGSCAFDRHKFLELGGFDPLLEPFYLEDTDLGYLAWKRGWKVYYQPRSIVYHEHRGTIGRKFTHEYIQAILNKNYVLFCWKNIHEWPRLMSHFVFTWCGAMLAILFGDVLGLPNVFGIWRAFRQLPQAMRSRWRARTLARIDDTEAFRRPMGGYFRDRFLTMERSPEPLNVLFVSPYPICPPTHGGGVFMYQTLRHMAKLADVHVVELLELDSQEIDNAAMREFCASVEWLMRPSGGVSSAPSLRPHAVVEFTNGDLEWLIHRQMYQKRIDVVQLEYTPMAQYRGDYRRIPCALFEHDIYFQSVGRGLGRGPSMFGNAIARFEYLRALRWELRELPAFDQVQVCTRANGEYLLSFLPNLAPRLRCGLRAGIDTSLYDYHERGREPLTMLFIGSFRHDPNRIAMDWFVNHVMPLVLARHPAAKLVVAGSDPPPEHAYSDFSGALQMLGYVDDVREPLARYAVFICPILSGSGVRVKLLEAFAAGIPVVSTVVGAEGLAVKDGEFCRLADDPAGFAGRIAELFEDPSAAAEMAARARSEVEVNWDMAAITRKLVDGYRELVREKRAHATSSSAPDPS